MSEHRQRPWLEVLLLASFLAVLLWSGIDPKDRTTWGMEVAPAVIGAIVLAATYARFRLTGLAYVLSWFFALILLVGGKYTYECMPLFNYIRDAFDLSRNHFDRFGHFFQGVTPAILARELLLRTSPLRRGKWLFVLVAGLCLAVSAMYELVEWVTAVTSGGSANMAFVGAQGDVWDAQKDMALCLIGAVTAQALLGRFHDRQLRQRGLAL